VQVSSWSFGRTVAASTAIAACAGVFAGAINLGSDFNLPARLVYGGLGGLIFGSIIGAISATVALIFTRLAAALGLRFLVSLRLIFVISGSLTVLLLSHFTFGPLSDTARALSLAAVGLFTVASGWWVARQSVQPDSIAT